MHQMFSQHSMSEAETTLVGSSLGKICGAANSIKDKIETHYILSTVDADSKVIPSIFLMYRCTPSARTVSA